MVALARDSGETRRRNTGVTRRVSDKSVRVLDPAQRERFADLMTEEAERRSKSAFAELFAFYAPRLKSYILRLGAADAEAEELVQEVMVTAWQKAGMYDRRQASVSTWLFRIARNRRIDLQRRQRRPELMTDDPQLSPAGVEAPDEAVSRLQELPREQLVLVQAAFYDGLSHSEIAEAFNLPLGTVKSRIRLAFQRLKGDIEPQI